MATEHLFRSIIDIGSNLKCFSEDLFFCIYGSLFLIVCLVLPRV